jgi:hypothetical protein
MKHLSGAALAALCGLGGARSTRRRRRSHRNSTSVLKLTVTISAPLSISASPSAPTVGCNAAPGSTVSTITPNGGDGTAISWALSGDTGDFAMSGNSLVVGANGIAAANCGGTQNVTITASQN